MSSEHLRPDPANAAILARGFVHIPESEFPKWARGCGTGISGRSWFVRDNKTTQDCVSLCYNFGGGLSAYFVHRKWIPDSIRLWDVAPQELSQTFRARLTEWVLRFQHEDGDTYTVDKAYTVDEAYKQFVDLFNGPALEWFKNPESNRNEEWTELGICPFAVDLNDHIAEHRKKWEASRTYVSPEWRHYFAENNP